MPLMVGTQMGNICSGRNFCLGKFTLAKAYIIVACDWEMLEHPICFDGAPYPHSHSGSTGWGQGPREVIWSSGTEENLNCLLCPLSPIYVYCYMYQDVCKATSNQYLQANFKRTSLWAESCSLSLCSFPPSSPRNHTSRHCRRKCTLSLISNNSFSSLAALSRLGAFSDSP